MNADRVLASTGDSTFARSFGVSEEASTSYNQRIVLAGWKKGALGDWLFNTFVKPGYGAEFDRLQTEDMRLKTDFNFRRMGWHLDSAGVWQPPVPTIRGISNTHSDLPSNGK